MATVKVLLKQEELNEKDELVKLIDSLKKSEREKLKGFLQGMVFSGNK